MRARIQINHRAMMLVGIEEATVWWRAVATVQAAGGSYAQEQLRFNDATVHHFEGPDEEVRQAVAVFAPFARRGEVWKHDRDVSAMYPEPMPRTP